MTHRNGDPCPSCGLDWVFTECPECGWTKSRDGNIAISGGDEPEADDVGEVPPVVSVTLPWDVLVSVNKRGLWGGGAEYREKRNAASTLVQFAWKGPAIAQPVKVSVTFYPPDRRGDPHNLLKCLYDSLERGGLLADDKLIIAWEGNVEQPTNDPRAEVVVTVLDMETGEAA